MRQSLPPWVPYVVPFALYLVLTAVEVRFPAYYPQFYAGKIVLVAIVALCLRSFSPKERGGVGSGSQPAAEYSVWPPPPGGMLPPSPPCDLPYLDGYERKPLPWKWLAIAVVAGIVLNWAWFKIDAVTPHPVWLTKIMGTRPAYDPFKSIASPVWRACFLGVRFAGLVALIPYLEERFYRDFLLRYAIDPGDFRRVSIGRLDPVAVAFSTVLFASTHPEWLAAAVFGLVMCSLVHFSRDIRVSIVAHAVTNLALGITVLSTGNWKYW